ncbi:hypothetical protein ABH931_003700 [Streptacidiphilus sp. MAP12-33]|uniref:hypothetical protein n=1 Tax=Streptacidiphilus sp. MAP12-33 TaxID=3156266 RepID=UPI003518E32A
MSTVAVSRYAVSGADGGDSAWSARFLADLQRELDRRWPGGFVRIGASPGDDPLLGARRADVVVALCSPDYFGDAGVVAEWTVAARRRTLGQARTGSTPRLLLPVRWQAMRQRLPSVAAELDVLGRSGLPREYLEHGLAQVLRRAPRLAAEYTVVLAALVEQMRVVADEATPVETNAVGATAVEERPQQQDVDQAGPFYDDDQAFTTRLRARLAETLPLSGDGPPVDVPRRVATVDGPGAALLREQLPDLGRRLMLTGPPGSGRRRELSWLGRAVLEERPGAGPWGCDVVLPLTARSGGMPPVPDLVQAVAPELAAEEPAGWAARRLRAGSVLLTLSGLEAQSARAREGIWDWLRLLLTGYPATPLAVATDGEQAPWSWLDDDFSLVRLQPWSLDETQAFLALAARGSGRQREQALARSLGALLARDPVLRELAAWPSGAAAVWAAALSGESGADDSALPSRRGLVDAAVAAAWRSARADGHVPHPGESGEVTPPAPWLTRAAGRLALVAQRAGTTEVSREEAAAAVSDRAEPDGRELVTELTGHAGVFYQVRHDRLAFGSAALRDCLAATELALAPVPSVVAELVGHLERSGSAEPILLVSQRLTGARRGAVLAGLLDVPVSGSVARLLPLAVALAATDEDGDRGGGGDRGEGGDRSGDGWGDGEQTVPTEHLRTALAGLGPLGAPELALVRRGGVRLRRLLPESERPAPARSNGSTTAPLARSADGEPVHRLAARLPSRTPGSGQRVVRSAAELAALAASPEADEVTELHWHGSLDGDTAPLSRLGGLRTLVLSGDPGLTYLPDLGDCASLRTLVVRDCPRLASLEALAGSQVVFAEFHPGPAAFDLDCAARARWLRRLDLVREQGGDIWELRSERLVVRVHGKVGLSPGGD